MDINKIREEELSRKGNEVFRLTQELLKAEEEWLKVWYAYLKEKKNE